MATKDFRLKQGLVVPQNVTISGTLDVTGTITGTLSGSATSLSTNYVKSTTTSVGSGISISPAAGVGVDITITNTDKGSSQNIWKDIANSAGTTQFSASSNTDKLRFGVGTFLSVTFDNANKTVTYQGSYTPVNKAGDTLTGSTFTGGTFNDITGLELGNGTGAQTLYIDGAAGNERKVEFRTAGSSRWKLGANSTAESGNSVGSDFEIQACNDSSTVIYTPITITRPTGAILVSTDTSFDKSINIGTTSGSKYLAISAGTSAAASIQFQTAGTPRWFFAKNNDAENGLNAGSDLRITAYDDNGVSIDSPLTIVRAAQGNITITRPLVIGANQISGSNVAFTGGTITGITDLAIADGGTGASTASAARTNLGATTVGDSFFTLTNPGAITFPKISAANAVTAESASTHRTSLGLGTAATQNTGTSGNNIPFLDGTNTWSGVNTYSTDLKVGDGTTGQTIYIQGIDGTNRDIAFRSGTSAAKDRWRIRINGTAESADAGSNLQILSYTDAGVVNPQVMSIDRIAGGTCTIYRPTTISGSNQFTSTNVNISGGTITGITDIAVADGGTGASTAAAARTNLGSTTVGDSFFTTANPSAITFPKVNANNTITYESASTHRTSLGLGTAATANTGTSGTNVPFLDGANTWSGNQTFGNTNTFGDGTSTTTVYINGATGTLRSIRYQTAGSDRWRVTTGSGAESGSNAGTPFIIQAFDDSGASIDNPITITRAAGASCSIIRPTYVNAGSLNVTPSTSGSAFRVVAITATDTATAASSTTNNFSHVSIGQPTLLATNTSVTTTTAANLYIVSGVQASTNEAITSSYGIFVTTASVAGGNGVTNSYGARISAPSGASTVNSALWVDGTCGVNQSAPAAQLHVTHSTLGNEVFRIESVATNDDPAESVYQNRVATTNATQTTLHTFAIPTSNTVMLDVWVIAKRSTTETGAGYRLTGVYKNVAGTVTLIGTLDQVAKEDVAGWDATLNISGTNVLCQVTGAASSNISWHMTSRLWKVST